MLFAIGIAFVVNGCAESVMRSEVYSASCPAVDVAIGPVLELFNELSDVIFWIKDADLKIRALNANFANRVKRENKVSSFLNGTQICTIRSWRESLWEMIVRF